MGMSGGDQGGFQSEINVTPMVDIMLVLLIIFMGVTPLLHHGIAVALQSGKTITDVVPTIRKEASIVVSNPNNAEHYLGKQKLAQDHIKIKVGPTLEKVE